MILKIIGVTPDASKYVTKVWWENPDATTHSSAVGCLIKPATKWRV